MSKYLSTFILFLLSIQAFSQIDYTPFPTENAYWSELRIQYIFDQNGDLIGDTKNTNYFIPYQDTIIDGLTFTKIYFSNDSILDLSNQETSLYGLMYQENKLVELYRPFFSGFEKVITYNFEIAIGDTLYRYEGINQVEYTYYLLDTIEEVEMLDGSFRNKYNYAGHHYIEVNDSLISTGPPTLSFSIIEGIGSNLNLFDDHNPPETITNTYWTTCFNENGQNIWSNPKYEYCFYNDTIYLLPIETLNLPNREISITPNPTSSKFQVQFQHELNETLEFRLFDYQGRLLNHLSVCVFRPL